MFPKSVTPFAFPLSSHLPGQRDGSAHKPSYWNFKSLVETAEWKHARSMARQLLREEETPVTPPRKPFHIEKLIHVEEYQIAPTQKMEAVKRSNARLPPKLATHSARNSARIPAPPPTPPEGLAPPRLSSAP